MKVSDIVDILNLKVITGHAFLEQEIDYAFASDLMSDVLILEKEKILLITGLSNHQALRTAEISEISVIIVGRDKISTEEMISLAEENKTILLESEFSVFRISGELYKYGIKPVY